MVASLGSSLLDFEVSPSWWNGYESSLRHMLSLLSNVVVIATQANSKYFENTGNREKFHAGREYAIHSYWYLKL